MSKLKKFIDIKNIVFALVGVIVGLLIGFLVAKPTSNTNSPDITKESEVAEEKLDAGNQVTTYLYASTKLAGDEKNAACDAILERLGKMKTDNTYLQVQVGDNAYDTYIYNKKGECFAQSDSGIYTSVTRSDGSTIKLDSENDAVIIEKDIDIITLMENAAKVAKNHDDIVVYDMETSEEGTKEYRIDMIGEEVFREVYDMFSAELGDIMVDTIVSNMGENWEPHLIYCYIMNEETVTLYCYVVENQVEYTNWLSQGYLTLGDWSLDEEWYAEDIETFNYEKGHEMLTALVTDLEEVLTNYAEANNIEMENTSNETNNETTTVPDTESTSESNETNDEEHE